jgi:hypothetical protein
MHMDRKSPLLSDREAAEYLRLKPATLRTWRSTHAVDVPHIKIGGRVFYRQPDLDQFLESCARRPAGTQSRRGSR